MIVVVFPFRGLKRKRNTFKCVVLSLRVTGWQRRAQRAPGPHLSGCGNGCRQPLHPGSVQNWRGPQWHQDRVPGGRMNCSGTRREASRREGEEPKRLIRHWLFLVNLLSLSHNFPPPRVNSEYPTPHPPPPPALPSIDTDGGAEVLRRLIWRRKGIR